MIIALWIIPVLIVYLLIRHMLDQHALRIERKQRIKAQKALAEMQKVFEFLNQNDIESILAEIELKYIE